MEYRVTTTLAISGTDPVVTVGLVNSDRETALREAQADVKSGINLADGTPVLREITFDPWDRSDSGETFDIIGDPEDDDADMITLGMVRYDIDEVDDAD